MNGKMLNRISRRAIAGEREDAAKIVADSYQLLANASVKLTMLDRVKFENLINDLDMITKDLINISADIMKG